MSQSLKYMGMGGLTKTGKERATGEAAQEGGEPSEPAPPRPGLRSVSTWTAALGRKPGEARPTLKDRKKSVADAQDEDDRHIRFTIGGVGQRMNKEDFIREMRTYDKGTRREIMDQSDASNRVKTLANQEAKPVDSSAQSSTRRAKTSSPAQQPKVSEPARQKEPAKTTTAQRLARDDSRRSSPSSGSLAASTPLEASPHLPAKEVEPSSRDEPETAVERRRRLAVLQSVDSEEDDDDNGVKETPAERRRREAALGMSSGAADDDSDDDDTPRVPTAGGRRGIRFADQPARG